MNITKQKRIALHSNPLSKTDMLEGDIFTRGTPKKVNWQAGRVARKHNISIHQANLISEILGFGRVA